MGVSPENLIVGLDVGTSKIAVLVAARDEEGNLTCLGGTQVQSRGLRNGVVVNFSDTAASIEAALYDAEEWCGQRITSACVSVGGTHILGKNTRGVGTITPIGREITHDDVTQAIAAARRGLLLEDNRDIIHEIPRAYTVDGQVGVADPHGMAGYQLDAEVHYVTGAATMIHNLLKSVRLAHIVPTALVATPLAAGETMLASYMDRQNLAVVDLGAETMGVALYVDGAIWLSAVFPIGGQDITKEIASSLQLPLPLAEQVKRRYGHCNPDSLEEYALVDLPPLDGMSMVLPHEELARVIQQQAFGFADALAPLLEEARHAGVEPEALMLTGGGAELPGLVDLLTQGLEIPVYRGVPRNIRQLPPALERPAFAAAAGLVLWQGRYMENDVAEVGSRKVRGLPRFRTRVKRFFVGMLP